ncbi:MAG: DUF4071 domain-containing protein [Candidatus Sabulitectum sp.]|nr:DUF4071 domain-containing protein [Candidatus Sabulitectum sp.]
MNKAECTPVRSEKEQRLADLLSINMDQYTTARYSLLHDLQNLINVYEIGAPEAVVFYCSRILEILTSKAMEKIGERPRRSILSNLVHLREYNVIPLITLHWAHAIRRTGNSARHILNAVSLQEAELSIFMLENVLDWYFCRFKYGEQLPSLTNNGTRIQLIPSTSFSLFLEELSNPDFPLESFVEKAVEQGNEYLFQFPAFNGLLIQMLLEHKSFEEADYLISLSRNRFAEDLRLKQLEGLLYSRRRAEGDLERALKCLIPVYRTYREDEDSYGILAGVYKRIWFGNEEQVSNLVKSHEVYLEGWGATKEASAYLGVNTAATALWLGKYEESSRIAAQVVELIRHRMNLIAQKTGMENQLLLFWDSVTLAEALLLSGEIREASYTYCHLVKIHECKAELIRLCLRQADRNLRAFGFNLSSNDFLNPTIDHSGSPGIAIGITGHRQLFHPTHIQEKIGFVLKKLAVKHRTDLIRVITPLAEGSDRLFALEAFNTYGNVFLDVILPFEVEEYCKDFSSSKSIEEFRKLLNKASRLVIADTANSVEYSQNSRDAAYLGCGKQVVNESDVLIAIWDGEGAGGYGGTADVVQYAREKMKPLVWVNSNPPFHITFERITSEFS